MKNFNDLVPIANTIADALNDGLKIGFVTVDGAQRVVVADPAASIELSATVSLPRILYPRDYSVASAAQSSQPAPSDAKPCRQEKKKSAKWWSRFNFEKNIMKMTLLALQDRYPDEESFTQTMFATKLAGMMHWKLSTAKRHITEAAKMGILNRAIIGTAYHVTGINDESARTLQEMMADGEDEPEEMPLPRSAMAQEGRIQFEQEFEKAVDETVLPEQAFPAREP